jgi:hypothetical protein
MRRALPLIPAFLRLCLALAVALVSSHTAIGRAEARGVDLIEICVGLDVALITLDANGDPVTSHQTCPDCVLSGLALTAIAAQAIPPAAIVSRAAHPASGEAVALSAPPPAAARGPPGIPAHA